MPKLLTFPDGSLLPFCKLTPYFFYYSFDQPPINTRFAHEHLVSPSLKTGETFPEFRNIPLNPEPLQDLPRNRLQHPADDVPQRPIQNAGCDSDRNHWPTRTTSPYYSDELTAETCAKPAREAI